MTVITRSFLDSTIARIIALVFSGLIVVLMIVGWGDDFSASNSAQLPLSTQLDSADNEALNSCLSKRLGDVNHMKKEGVLNEHQFTQFKSRAMSLCHAQNPS
ncbi:MAG: hypothetical protein JKX94_10250 [Sneathiella sp.]|nr:hypothetical protein [Sneathiella sp.]